MAEEDAELSGDDGRLSGGDDARLSGSEDAGRPRPRERDETEGLGFSLPPIKLPEVKFPDRIRLVFPIPEPPEKVSKPTRIKVSQVLLAVVLVDALDALAVLLVGPTTLPWVRATAGTLLSILFAGPLGLLYPWELLAIVGGAGWLALAPTLTLLVLARMTLAE
jgi:hypothetical protein